MNTEAKKQYMDTLREGYLRGSKKEKGKILDEYCRNTGQNRKYVGKKFRYKVKLKEFRKNRKEHYDGEVKTTLSEIWKIFDYPCGARLKPLLTNETEKLRVLGEIKCSNGVAEKLHKIGMATIDRKLKHEKEILLLSEKYKKRSPLLCHQVPVKTSAEFDRNIIGHTEIDFVESNGASAGGEFVNNLSVVDVASAWWEGEAVMGKSQERALLAVQHIRERAPYAFLGMHPDNGTNLLNYIFYEYAQTRQNFREKFRRARKTTTASLNKKILPILDRLSDT